MSENMKIWMRIGGALLVIGLILGSVGLAMGAWNYRDQWSISLRGNRFGLWLDDDGNANYGFEGEAGDLEEIVSYDAAADIRNLDIDADVCSVAIWRGDEYRLQVSEKMADTVTATWEDGTWQITQKSKSGWGNSSNSNATVVITVPKEVTFEKITCNLGVGELDAERLVAGEIDLESGVGDLTLDGVECAKLSVSCGTGSADIGASVISESAELENGVGDLDLELEGMEEDYNYSVSCGMGSVQIGSILSVDGLNGDQTIDRGQDCWIHADNGVGDVTINFTGNSVQ